MKRIYVDAETYWSDDYTLSDMVTIDYILDPRFECIGWGVAIDSNPPFWLPRDKIKIFLNSQTEPYICISHNALFDMSILAYRYGIFPTLSIDTLGICRAILMSQLPNGRAGLEAVARFLGIGAKNKTVLKTKNKTRKEIENTGWLYNEFKQYCLDDVSLCRSIYLKLKDRFPASEYIIMDMIIRTTTQLQLQLNIAHLQQHLTEVKAAKQKLLDDINVTVNDLMSNEKFALALKSLGVQPPTKISPATTKLTWAFARADKEFMELLDHPDPDVQALMAARLGHKSTLEETRTEKFINIAKTTKNSYGESYMPMALRYSGAHTHRFSGDWGLNTQNLPSRKSKLLRQSIVAPKGYVILECDASQIEARLTAWFARQTDLLSGFELGIDIYKEFATELFHRSLNEVTKVERFIAKTCILGLGFQLGKVKLANTLNAQAKDQNLMLNSLFTTEQTEQWVNIYRNKYNNIKRYWYYLRDLLPLLANGGSNDLIRDCCKIEHQSILLPNSLRLYYHNLYFGKNNQWWFTYGGRKKKLYGGKLLENLVQALDRIIVMDAALRIFRRTGIRIVHQLHDALIYLVEEKEVDNFSKIVLEEMCKRPTFAPDLPLSAEIKIGRNYGELQ